MREKRWFLVEFEYRSGLTDDLSMLGYSPRDVVSRFRKGARGANPRRWFGPKPPPANVTRVFPL